MEKATGQSWAMGQIMPHEKLMDQKNLDFNDLSETIQEDVRNFDRQHDIAVKDGDITKEEHTALLAQSHEIAKKMRIEEGGNSTKKSSGSGIFFGLLIGIGATLGISKLLKP
jgi:hypothetical protein